MDDDVRFILMDRLIRFDAHLRATGRISGNQDPSYLEATPEEQRLLGETCYENGEPVVAKAFYGIPLRIVEIIDCWLTGGGLAPPATVALDGSPSTCGAF